MPDRKGAWARGGAIASAALASMCCILPLAFGALGFSTTVVAAFFVPLRPWFLTLAVVLLSAGFYFAFVRPAEGQACSTDSRWLSKLSKPALWFSTIAVVGLALFPSISGVAAGGNQELSLNTASEIVVLNIQGMTCESCSAGVRTALLDVPGVIDAAVSYERKNASVRVRSERPPKTTALLAAIEEAGYSAVLDSR